MTPLSLIWGSVQVGKGTGGPQAKHTCCFHGHWHKVVACFQHSILQSLPLFCLSCDCTCFFGCQRGVGGTKVSRQVASHTRTWPVFQGITVSPSGHFPSGRQMLDGSRWEGTPADVVGTTWPLSGVPGYMDHLIVHTQIQRRHREGMQSRSRLLCSNSKEAGMCRCI